jgi:hypothetical protein
MTGVKATASAGRITRPVMLYHGGKWKMAPWIISCFPELTQVMIWLADPEGYALLRLLKMAGMDK